MEAHDENLVNLLRESNNQYSPIRFLKGMRVMMISVSMPSCSGNQSTGDFLTLADRFLSLDPEEALLDDESKAERLDLIRRLAEQITQRPPRGPTCIDVLSSGFEEIELYNVCLANPPFNVLPTSVQINPTLPATSRTELLFINLLLRLLKPGGICGVVVPEGVLFGNSKIHRQTRQKLVEEHRLEGVISIPAGVFKPHTGVATTVLIFTKAGTTDLVLFYELGNVGVSLDNKHRLVAENDISDLLACWRNRHKSLFLLERQDRLAQLRAELAQLKPQQLAYQSELEFQILEKQLAEEEVETQRTAQGDDPQVAELKAKLAILEPQIAAIEVQIAQLKRSVWVTKEEIMAGDFHFQGKRYQPAVDEPVYQESPLILLRQAQLIQQLIDRGMQRLWNELTHLYEPTVKIAPGGLVDEAK